MKRSYILKKKSICTQLEVAIAHNKLIEFASSSKLSTLAIESESTTREPVYSSDKRANRSSISIHPFAVPSENTLHNACSHICIPKMLNIVSAMLTTIHKQKNLI